MKEDISPWLHHTKLYVEHQPNSSTSFSPMQAVMPSQLRLGVLSSEFGTASILSPLPLRASLVIMVVSPPNTWFDHQVMQTSLVSIQRWVCWCTCSVGDWAHWKRLCSLPLIKVWRWWNCVFQQIQQWGWLWFYISPRNTK